MSVPAVAGGLEMQREDYIAKRDALSQRSIDELIDLLSSDGLQTRFLAEMCLRDATNT